MDHLKQPDNSRLDTNHMHEQQTVQIPSTENEAFAEQPTMAGSANATAEVVTETLPQLPGYSIEGVLGRGGMGVVYQALQRPLNRPVALKMILSGEHAGAEDRLRFLAEAESIAKVQHPGIVQLYEFGSHEGHPYFALEYVTGGTLEKKLSGTPLPPRDAAQLVEKLARAMQAAHDLGIVHRDLKPANVLLTQAGEPKITDFGLAKTGGSNLTATGAILGTPSYMAPEQADGSKDVGTPTDIYALGAILYECLTGRPPFKAATHLDTILQVVNNEPVSVRNLQVTTPQDLETICHKCLAKEPGKRYATMAALAEDLRRYLHNEPIEARPVGRLEKSWRWCRRNPVVAGLAGSVALLLLGVAIASLLISLYVQKQNSDLEDANVISKRNEEKAHTAAEEARALLSRQYAMNASRAIDDGDHASALVWTSEAIKVSSDDPAKLHRHRIQFNELLKQHPVPLGVWQSEYSRGSRGADFNEKPTYFTKNGKLALIPAQDRFQIIDLQRGMPFKLPELPAGFSITEVVMPPDGELIVALCICRDRLDSESLFSLARHDTWNGIPTFLTKAIDHVCSHALLIAWEPNTARIHYKKLIAPAHDIIDYLYQGGSIMKMDPSGKRLLVNQTLVEVSTGKLLATMDVASISRCYFNQDGTKIINVYEQRLVNHANTSQARTWYARVWNIQQTLWETPAVKLPGHVSDGGFNSEGTPLVAVLCDEGPIPSKFAEVWDIQKGKQLVGPLDFRWVDQSRLQLDNVYFGPGLHHVIARTYEGYSVWDLIIRKEIRREKGEEVSIEFSNLSRPTSELIITGDSQGMVAIRNLANDRLACPPIQMKNKLSICQFTPDGNHFLVGTKDGRLELYGFQKQSYYDGDPQSNKTWTKVYYRRLVVFQHTGEVQEAVFDEKGKHLLTCWNTPEGISAFTLWRIHSSPLVTSNISSTERRVSHASFTKNLQSLVIGSGDKAFLYQSSIESRKFLKKATFSTNASGVGKSVISNDQRLCLYTTNHRLGNSWSSDSSTQITLHQLHQFQSPLTLLNYSKGRVFDMAFSPDCSRCAALVIQDVVGNEYRSSLYLWDTATGKPVCSPKEYRAWGGTLLFSKNSQELIYFSRDQSPVTKVQVFGVQDGISLPSPRHTFSANSVISSHQSSNLMVSSEDNYYKKDTKVWDLNNLEKPKWQADINVNHAHFNVDGTKLATASGMENGFHGEARIWDAHTGKPLSPVMAHPFPVQRVHYLDEEKLLLSVCGRYQYDEKSLLCLWDTQLGVKLLPPWPIESPVAEITYDASCRSFVIILMNGSLLTWQVKPCDQSPENIERWARTMTGKKIDDTGFPSPVSLSEFSTLIQQARKDTPELLTGTVSDQVAWNEAKLSQSQDPKEKKPLLDELKKLEPQLSLHRMRSAENHQQLGLHREAIEDHAWLCVHEAHEPIHWFNRGVFFAKTLYQAHREQSVEQAFRYFDEGAGYLFQAMKLGTLPNDETGSIHELNWSILQDSRAGIERWKHALKLEHYLAEIDGGYQTSEVMALALFRIGKYQEAFEMINKTISEYRLNNEDRTYLAHCLIRVGTPLHLPIVWIWGSYHPNDLIVRAMIEQQMGNTEAARKTRKLLAILMFRPENKDCDIKELDAMLAQPAKK